MNSGKPLAPGDRPYVTLWRRRCARGTAPLLFPGVVGAILVFLAPAVPAAQALLASVPISPSLGGSPHALAARVLVGLHAWLLIYGVNRRLDEASTRELCAERLAQLRLTRLRPGEWLADWTRPARLEGLLAAITPLPLYLWCWQLGALQIREIFGALLLFAILCFQPAGPPWWTRIPATGARPERWRSAPVAGGAGLALLPLIAGHVSGSLHPASQPGLSLTGDSLRCACAALVMGPVWLGDALLAPRPFFHFPLVPALGVVPWVCLYLRHTHHWTATWLGESGVSGRGSRGLVLATAVLILGFTWGVRLR